MKKLFIIIFIGSFLVSCSKSDDVGIEAHATVTSIEPLGLESSGQVYAINYASDPQHPTEVAIQAALNAIGGASETLVLNYTTWSINNSITIPSNICLLIDDPTLVSIAAGKTFTIRGTTSINRYQKFIGSGSVSIQNPNVTAVPQWWGAVQDGVTDCGPGIRKALASGTNRVYLAVGTYLIKTLCGTQMYNAEYAFELPSNMTIWGDGATNTVIRMNNGLLNATSAPWGGGVFMSQNKSSISAEYFGIDLNGGNNLVPAGTTRTGYAFYMVACSSVSFDNLKMSNTPGMNFVLFTAGGSGNNITNCEFKNGGTSIPSNTNQYDFSAVYITSTYSQVSSCYIHHDYYPFNYCGGIEDHGSNNTIQDNTIYRSMPGIYVCADTLNAVNTGGRVQGNMIYESLCGIIFAGDGSYSDLTITSNQFHLQKFTAPALAGLRSYGIYHMRSDTAQNMTISNSEITQNQLWDTDSYQSSDRCIFMHLDNCYNLDINNNTIYGCSGYAFYIVSGPSGINTLYIHDNTISNFGTNSGPYGHVAISCTFSNYNGYNMHIYNNTIRRDVNNAGFYAFYFDWGPSSNLETNPGQFDIWGNTITNVPNIKGGPKASRVTIR